MQQVTFTYSEEELAWVSPPITLHRDIYLAVELLKPGKLVIRQGSGNGHAPRVPIRRHKDTKSFRLRFKVIPADIKIQIFTSTQPKEVVYAYI